MTFFQAGIFSSHLGLLFFLDHSFITIESFVGWTLIVAALRRLFSRRRVMSLYFDVATAHFVLTKTFIQAVPRTVRATFREGVHDRLSSLHKKICKCDQIRKQSCGIGYRTIQTLDRCRLEPEKLLLKGIFACTYNKAPLLKTTVRLLLRKAC